jgi:two-component system chemotaxis response regulator CheB
MSTYRILLVDDSPFMRKVYGDLIVASGRFEIAGFAGDGEEAVRLTRDLAPDVVVMDLEMPKMNGIEALREIMAARPTPVILMSAVSEDGMRETILALQAGAFDFVRKPDASAGLGLEKVSKILLERLFIAAETGREGRLRLLAQTPASVPVPRAPAKQSAQAPAAPPARTPKERQIPLRHPVRPPGEAGSPKTGGAQAPSPRPAAETPQRKLPAAGKRESAAAAPEAGAARERKRPARAGAAVGGTGTDPKTAAPAVPDRPAKAPERNPLPVTRLIAIGVSTGGPRALHQVLTALPADFPAPLLIVQHMPPRFTRSLAQRLDQSCRIRVREAENGELVENGTAYIAPGGLQMTLAKELPGRYRIHLEDGPPRNGHKPSVDVLFDSLVGLSELERVAVLLTGMGSDGAKGLKKLREDGAETIAESEETCVVYGMPRSAIQLGAATHVLPLHEIARWLIRKVA